MDAHDDKREHTEPTFVTTASMFWWEMLDGRVRSDEEQAKKSTVVKLNWFEGTGGGSKWGEGSKYKETMKTTETQTEHRMQVLYWQNFT